MPPISPEQFASKLLASSRDHKAVVSNLFCSLDLASKARRTVRLHVLRADGNGRPQVGVLVRQLASMTLDYCIPRRQVTRALKQFRTTNSTSRVVALQTEARKLFSDVDASGEGGELLLFLLTEAVLGYPQAVAKMSLKTNARMHVHGLDGIYVSCTGTPPTLRLHYGESKIHASPAKSVRDAVSSIAAILKDEGCLDAGRRDFYLLNNFADLGDAKMEAALTGFLDPEDERYMRPQTAAVLLAGHDRKKYPVVNDDASVPATLIKKSKDLLGILEDEAGNAGIGTFELDVFLVPFPDVSTFREALAQELGI